MSSVIIAGDTSGTVTLSAPAVAGTTTLTLPATSGTVLQSGTAVTTAQGGTGLTTAGTSGNVLTSDGTNWTSAAGGSITTLASNVSVGTGASFTISGLTLTSYKFLFLSVVNATATAGTSYIAIGGTPTASNSFGNLSNAYSSWASVILDLTAQTQLSPALQVRFASGITTASTSITVNMLTNSFATGTYYLYGMK